MKPAWPVLRVVLVCVLTSCCAHAPIARSQETPENTERDSDVAVFVDFGLAGKVIGSAWTPAVVVVQPADAPIGGVVEIEYVAGGETVRHLAPFAAVPGRETRVPMVIRLPWWTQRVTASAISDSGELLASIEYESAPDDRSARLPSIVQPEGFLLSATRRVTPAMLRLAAGETDSVSKSWGVGSLAADKLPASRLAYDSVSLLVVDPAEKIAPSSMDAITRWVASGGHLVLLTDRPGGEWRRWVDPTMLAQPVLITDVSMETVAQRDVSARMLESTGIGTANGWRIIQIDESNLVDDAGQTDESRNGSKQAVAATGPMGLGRVTLVSFDLSVFTDESAESLLNAVLLGSQPAVSDPSAILPAQNANRWNQWSRRGDDWAIFQGLDALAISELPGASSFLLITTVPLLLVVLLGPVDYIGLGILRKRNLAWMTALFWIVVVGGIAVLLPQTMRSGQSEVGTAAVIDAVVPNISASGEASIPEAAMTVPEGLRAWRTGASLVFSGSGEAIKLAADTSSAWRPMTDAGSDTFSISSMDLRQIAPGPGLESHAAVVPLNIPSRIWSLATMRDAGPTAVGFSVGLTRLPETYALVIERAPEDMQVVSALLTTAEGVRVPVEFEPDARTLRFRTDRAGSAGTLTGIDTRMQTLLAGLLNSEPTKRSGAMASMVEAGWARLYLMVNNPPNQPRFTTSDALRETTHALYRIMIPLPEPSP